MTPADATRIVDGYCACWAPMAEGDRLRRLSEVMVPEATYSDPSAQVTGIEALVAHVGAVLEGLPGMVLWRTTEVDLHHDTGRFGWQARTDAGPMAESVDFVRFAPDGRLVSVTGFFGPMKPKAG